ncbi:hypothetical protein DPMN_079180 [Dreissena polymorpha]|uniref:Uncharacterized protein n=1 Tax=Dreissena polymorpha TaxID=45954 RepID=A0A9D3YS38_DREPO|nr:hypothetical protein DPMN_079180 [Dreissena polymorpha]
MECRARIQLECQAALLQAQIGLLNANLAMHRLAQKRAMRRRQRRWWIRAWLGSERRRQFGLYDQLMVKLRYDERTNVHSSTSCKCHPRCSMRFSHEWA